MRASLWLLCLFAASVAAGAESANLGLKVPEGFEVSLYADDDLAHDIYSMTIDARGRVVVAGPGYIKTLHDDNGDGRADRATVFSKFPASGAHGLCFDGDSLVCTGDNGLWRLRDTDGDGTADGEPELWAKLGHSEHGANGVTRGPDGWFYVICGNDAGVTADLANTDRSPIKQPQCGAVVRFSPNGNASEIVAHGFRNPYDLAFGVDGELYTVDSDGERDQHLPWYEPTRLFEIAPGMHHGWVLNGWQQSWSRPAWFPDTADRLAEIGRGSPTGVTVYRHRQFPPEFHGDLFTCCWTLGRVYRFDLKPGDVPTKLTPEIFLETTGDVGFAPVDIVVGVDGDLLVAIGGRRTRGGVFAIHRQGATGKLPRSDDPLDAVEPLAAWSRAQWLPRAKRLGKNYHVLNVENTTRSAEERLRAVEIIVDVFGGVMPNDFPRVQPFGVMPGFPKLPRVPPGMTEVPDERRMPRGLGSSAKHPSDMDRLFARVVWGATTYPLPDDPRIRTAWQDLWSQVRPLRRADNTRRALSDASLSNRLPALWSPPSPNVASHRLRQASLLAPPPPAAKNSTTKEPDPAPLDLLWTLHRQGKLLPEHAATAARKLREFNDEPEVLEAIRLIELALGDVGTISKPEHPVAGYFLQGDLSANSRVVSEVTRELLAMFPDENREINYELARLFAALRTDEPRLPGELARLCTESSLVVDDLHYLIVLSLVPGTRDPSTTEHTAQALVRLAGKMAREGRLPARNWPLRVGETFQRLCERDPNLAAAVVAQPEFGHSDHTLFIEPLPAIVRTTAAEKVLAQAVADDREWTVEMVRVASFLPEADRLRQLRDRWDEPALRDAITEALARSPQRDDRERFVAGLASPQPEIVELAADALRELQLAPNEQEWLELVRALRRMVADPTREASRVALVKLVSQWSGGKAPGVPTGKEDARTRYEPQLAWILEQHPSLKDQLGKWSDDVGSWQERLRQVDWSSGDVMRGKAVFEKLACHRCHLGSGPLGPDLTGVSQRWSRDDLFRQIIEPSLEVSPTYQTTQVVTANGRVVVGLIVYESPESTLVQTGADITVRVAGDVITSMTKSTQSLMPTGLLNEATAQDIADLYEYLRTLRR